MTAKNSQMSADDYVRESTALESEMRRIRVILDRHAHNKGFGAEGIRAVGDDSLLIQKTLDDQDNVIERFRKLNEEFWGATRKGSEN